MRVLPEPVAKLSRARFLPVAIFSSVARNSGVLVVALADFASGEGGDDRFG